MKIKVEIPNIPKQNINNMQVGDIAFVPSLGDQTDFYLCRAYLGFFRLDDPRVTWSNTSGNIPCEILPPGTVITLTL